MRPVKFLCIAILRIVVGNAECAQQTVFDLPATEAYDLGEQLEADGILEYFLESNHVIKFPMDGHQPTTHEAVEYSCANIDNRENSPITEWYMKMFGVIPFRNVDSPGADDYIKAGWSAPADGAITAQRIISFSISINNSQVNDPYDTRIQISLKNLFIKELKKIASTSVGRVLLYRILIEVRRHIQDSNIGTCGNDIVLIANSSFRERNRSIEIDKGQSQYVKGSGRIKFDVTNIRNAVIGRRKNLYSYIATDPTLNDVNIFHEMIHWFHYLRNPGRQTLEEKVSSDELCQISESDGVYQCYWGMLDDGTSRERLNSMTPWRADDACQQVLLEEIRTMLGMPKNASYIEGDDLSENLYRACTHQPLCFGHESLPFYEDNRVINKVLQVTNSGVVGYLLDFENPNYRNAKIFDKGYTPYYTKKGLGNSYFR